MPSISELLAENERLKREARDQQAGKCAEQKRRVYEVTKLEKELAQAREEAERLESLVRKHEGHAASWATRALDAERRLSVQASPPACEGERRVDLEALSDELADVMYKRSLYPSSHPATAKQLLTILRRHFPEPAEPAAQHAQQPEAAP